MVSEASKKKAAQKKAAAAAKRGGKAAAAAAANKAAARNETVEHGMGALVISDRTCTGVLCSHPLSRDIRVRMRFSLFRLPGEGESLTPIYAA
uniref:ABC transporter F family member 1 n=1 Tax=Tanacetum cinerariifolium TaxID=118510 RepID=A0A699HA92_TANCI|nr:ABC transporter F family member 1 [Tanacetum cinerariifolium]